MKHISADDNDVMDIVNDNDEVVGTITQADAINLLKTKVGYIRGTVAFVQNDAGKLWTPRRAANKRVAPNGLDYGVAEHVQKGETYEEGIIRGFKEELLLDIDKSQLQYLGKLDPIQPLPYFITAVYLYKANEVKDYNHADFTGYEWLDPQEIIDRIDKGDLAKSALKISIQKYLL